VRINAKRLIREWFLEHDGDGEFVSGVRAFPYSVIGSSGSAGCVIFTTKPTVVSAVLHDYEAATSPGMVGRYGLPDDADLLWIRKVIGRRSLLFLGDMDPVDLLVFAWLCASLRPKRIAHLGVNDAFLRALKVGSTKSLSTPCVPSERESLTLLKKVLPDLRHTVGPKCARMLERGEKLELEAILSNREKAARSLRSLLPSLNDSSASSG